MRAGYGWLRAARVLAVTLLAVVLVIMATSDHHAEQKLGPFPSGDGDAVSVAPRVLP